MTVHLENPSKSIENSIRTEKISISRLLSDTQVNTDAHTTSSTVGNKISLRRIYTLCAYCLWVRKLKCAEPEWRYKLNRLLVCSCRVVKIWIKMLKLTWQKRNARQSAIEKMTACHLRSHSNWESALWLTTETNEKKTKSTEKSLVFNKW